MPSRQKTWYVGVAMCSLLISVLREGPASLRLGGAEGEGDAFDRGEKEVFVSFSDSVSETVARKE